MPTDEPGPTLPLECAELGPDEIEAYLEFRPDQARAEVERRFGDGDHCFVARSQGRVVCSAWIARGSAWLPFVPCRVRLDERAFYTYDVYVPALLRGKRVANVVMDHRAARMRELGCDRKVSVVEPENRSSFQRNLRRDLEDLGRLSCLRIGPWQWVWIRRRAPDVDPLVTVD